MDCGNSIACALRGIFGSLEGSNPFEVWSLIVIPAAAAVGTIAVAIASWLTSRRATAIADGALKAESKRSEAEEARVEAERVRQYSLVLESRLADVMVSVARHAQAVHEWEASTRMEKHPLSHVLTAQVEAARMVSRDVDREVLARFQTALAAINEVRTHKETQQGFRFLVILLRDWRDGTITPEQALAELRKRESAATALKQR